MAIVKLETDFRFRLIPLDEYVAEEIQSFDARGTLEEQQARLECLAGRLGRLVNVLYDAGVIGIEDIQQIVGGVNVPGGEFRGTISIREV